MKYIKQNIEGYNIKFKIITTSIDVRNHLYTLQIKYKYKSNQILGYYIDFDKVYSLDEYKTSTDKELSDMATPYLIKDIKRREAFIRRI